MRVEAPARSWIVSGRLTGPEKGRPKAGPEQGPRGGALPQAPSEGDLDLRALLEIAQLRRIDQMVRAHERAHLAAGGELVISGPHYVYRRGPDGRLYAVGGDVVIDTSGVPGDPEATLRKAERIIRAALAPLNPSPQDLRVALRAQMMAMQARLEVARERMEEGHAYRA
ncbi:putative metalloprotease CJM1_0395 family protein [Thermosulfurimonas marina]|nr:putative metalloprotease CJM1_0395 family protein [Thermosulfurimonas marina]